MIFMNQSLYLIDETFFDTKEDLSGVWAKQIENHCISEKATLVFDPICFPLFKKMVSNDAALKQLVVAYYTYFEENYKAELSWDQLDRESVQYVDALMELLYTLDWRKRSVSAYGCFPLVYNNMTMHLFFFISPYFDENKFCLVSDREYIKNYQLIVDTLSMYGL